MGPVQLPSHRGERQARFLLRHAGVEGIDAAVLDGVPRWRAALEDERQVRQRLLFPRGHVGEDVSDRPVAGDARLHQLRVRSEEHTSELRHEWISYAVFCLKKKKIEERLV